MLTIGSALATLPPVGRLVGLGSAVLMTLSLVACGDKGGADDLPAFQAGTDRPSTSESGDAEPAGTPTLDPGAPLPAKGALLGDPKNAIKVGRTVTGDRDKEAVQTAYLAFWAERAKALRLAKADITAIRAVSGGVAADRIISSVNELKAKKQHTEGGSTVNVQTVTVKGTTAKITDCFQDTSANRTADGKVAEQPKLDVSKLAAGLEKQGDVWKVTSLDLTQIRSCKH
jgi:hypothetical protein